MLECQVRFVDSVSCDTHELKIVNETACTLFIQVINPPVYYLSQAGNVFILLFGSLVVC